MIAYYAVVIGVVGPTCFARAGAAPVGRLPVRISLNVAMHTRTTDVATFTTPFPITLGIASDGAFTIPRDRLAFALVDVSVATPGPAFSRFSVRAAATSDFAGTVDTTTGTATLGGSLELLWSQPKLASDAAGSSYMLDCPVGPFAVHLSTATIGGTPLGPLAHADPSSRTARLVDDNLDVGAIPGGTKQCAGDEGGLNGALSLPIRPKATTTTTTTTVAADSTTSTMPTTTTTATATTNTTDTTDTTTTTATTSTSTTIAGDSSTAGPPTDALGAALDPNVLAFEPSPSIVSTLTIAPGIPAAPVTSTTAATPRRLAPATRSTPTPVARLQLGVTRHKPPTVEAPKSRPHKRRTNKHAQTDAAAATTTTAGSARNSTPPLYFSPFNFGAPRIRPPKLLAPGPLFNLGKSALAHHTNVLFVVLLALPLVIFALGLVARDLGWWPRRPGRRRPESGAHSRAR